MQSSVAVQWSCTNGPRQLFPLNKVEEEEKEEVEEEENKKEEKRRKRKRMTRSQLQ